MAVLRAENDDYNKASIYSILYGLYQHAGTVKCGTPCYGKTADGKPCGQAPCEGVDYQFTFNTWGIAPSPYPPEDPQRHGKAAYAGLVNFPEVKAYMEKNGDAPKIVEIGCGTGAGANLITREIIPKAHYVRSSKLTVGCSQRSLHSTHLPCYCWFDRWQSTCRRLPSTRAPNCSTGRAPAAPGYCCRPSIPARPHRLACALRRCLKIHGNAENPGLHCRQEPGGVGNGGNRVRDENGVVMADGSVDFVIISETHIADVQIGAAAALAALQPGSRPRSSLSLLPATASDSVAAQGRRRKRSSTRFCAS